jgi:hypothetical protein
MDQDWTKFVTLNPPNEVKFKIVDEQEELQSSQNLKDGQKKAIAKIQIINKSQSAILFKVSSRHKFIH